MWQTSWKKLRENNWNNFIIRVSKCCILFTISFVSMYVRRDFRIHNWMSRKLGGGSIIPEISDCYLLITGIFLANAMQSNNKKKKKMKKKKKSRGNLLLHAVLIYDSLKGLNGLWSLYRWDNKLQPVIWCDNFKVVVWWTVISFSNINVSVPWQCIGVSFTRIISEFLSVCYFPIF